MQELSAQPTVSPLDIIKWRIRAISSGMWGRGLITKEKDHGDDPYE